MSSQLNASNYYSIGYKQAPLKGVYLPISCSTEEAFSFLQNDRWPNNNGQYFPRKLVLPDTFDKVPSPFVSRAKEQEAPFLVECCGQLRDLGREKHHGICVYTITNKATSEKHALVAFAGQCLSNFVGSDRKKYCGYSVHCMGDPEDKTIVLPNHCSEFGFQLAKAASVFASLHRLTEGGVGKFQDFPAIQKVLQSATPSDTKKATNGTNMPIPSEYFQEAMADWQARAPGVMLRCLVYKCRDHEFLETIASLYTRCVQVIGVHPDNIRWAEIDPFGDNTWGVGLKPEQHWSILETAWLHLSEHGVDKFPGKNLMGQCLRDLTVIFRDPVTRAQFCSHQEVMEIIEHMEDHDNRPFIQLVPKSVWRKEYCPQPATDVGTSLKIPVPPCESCSDSEDESQAKSPPESEQGSPDAQPGSPDYCPQSPNYVPDSPTDPRTEEMKAERIAKAAMRVNDFARLSIFRTKCATDQRADVQYQLGLIEDAEEYVKNLREACPIAAVRLEKKRQEWLGMEMQVCGEESSVAIGRGIALQLAEDLTKAVSAAVRPMGSVEVKDEVIRMAESLIKAVKMTHPLYNSEDILSDEEPARDAKRPRLDSGSSSSSDSDSSDSSSSDSSHQRPVGRSRLFRTSSIRVPGSPKEHPSDQVRRLRN